MAHHTQGKKLNITERQIITTPLRAAAMLDYVCRTRAQQAGWLQRWSWCTLEAVDECNVKVNYFKSLLCRPLYNV